MNRSTRFGTAGRQATRRRQYPIRYLACLALTPGLVLSPAMADHTPEHTLEELVITAPGTESLTITPTFEAREMLYQIPGGTTLIDADEFRTGTTASLQQVLSLSPGVYVQSRFGGGETRTSIRGSGISQTFNTRGIRFLLNGLPFTEADGNFRPQLVEPLAMRHVEVYRGANALPYGAAFLGGAVNFVSPTAHTAPNALGRIELGSFGYVRPQLSAAGALDNGADGYLSLSGLFQDGFRPQSKEETYRLYGNVGYRFTPNSETRLHVSVQDNQLQLPGSLTRAQVKADPTQANDFWRMRGATRDFDLYRTDLQHAVHLGGGSRLELGAFYQRLDMHHPLPFQFLESSQNDTGASLRHQFETDLGGLRQHITWGGLFAWGDSDSRQSQSLGTLGKAVRGDLQQINQSEAITAELFAENRLELTERLDLVAGLQLAYARRKNRVPFDTCPGFPPQCGVEATKSYYGINPKAGLLFQANDTVQLFGNVSRSFEPPTTSEFIDATTDVLDAQTATTIEFGTRHTGPLLSWELAFYHSWVEDEILTIDPNPPSGQFITSNTDGTTLHTGVELGFDARLPLEHLFGETRRGDVLHLVANYTYNRLVFDDEPTWGDNDIPGIPRQFGRLELLYRNPAGFYIGPALEAASAWYVDFANTLKADAFWALGAKAGYEGQHFSAFIEGRNLTNRKYASNTGLIADAGGMDQGVFNPAIPASVFGGIEIRF